MPFGFIKRGGGLIISKFERETREGEREMQREASGRERTKEKEGRESEGDERKRQDGEGETSE